MWAAFVALSVASYTYLSPETLTAVAVARLPYGLTYQP